MRRTFVPNCLPTGIGSVPQINVGDAWRCIIENFPAIPYWPQLPNLHPKEQMNFQYIGSMPGLSSCKKKLLVDTLSVDTACELDEFYRMAQDNNIDYFAIDPDHSAGLWSIEEYLGSVKGILAVKGQIIGPVSLGLGATDAVLKPLLYNDIFRDVIITDLKFKSRWLERRLEKVCPTTMVMFDEPFLSFVDSAFGNLNQEEVTRWLTDCASLLKGLWGVHCCSNMDWGFLMRVGMDIISFDAFTYGDRFVLYAEELTAFLGNGGIVAWGMVPTNQGSMDKINGNILLERFENILSNLEIKGLSRELVLRQSLVTPSCGLGSGTSENSLRVHFLTRELSQKIRARYELV